LGNSPPFFMHKCIEGCHLHAQIQHLSKMHHRRLGDTTFLVDTTFQQHGS
jgi:hypothetical protein